MYNKMMFDSCMVQERERCNIKELHNMQIAIANVHAPHTNEDFGTHMFRYSITIIAIRYGDYCDYFYMESLLFQIH